MISGHGIKRALICVTLGSSLERTLRKPSEGGHLVTTSDDEI